MRANYQKMFANTLLVALACLPSVSASVGCTAILVSKGATADGSTMTTHNADCLNCDFRVGYMPAGTHEAGTPAPLFKYRAEYPHLVTETRADTWKVENLEDLPQREVWASEEFVNDMITSYVPQVEKTYALYEALFGLINEKGLAMGESTCAARWFGKPVRSCPTCEGPGIEAISLSKLALERCETARCAIELMGSFAAEFGYYAADLSRPEGGEALTIVDGEEAWMFHILPDDTGDEVVWCAQKLEDGHISVAANRFSIRGVDPDSPDFIYSSNMYDVAERNGLWKEGEVLDFTATFGYDTGHKEYGIRRVWRVLSLAAPSLGLSAENITWTMDGLPFSVKPDKPLTARDIMAMNRDLYQGTPYDLTEGIAGGPFGDPARFDTSANTEVNHNGVTQEELAAGGFERAISMFRTSYSFVAVSRPHLKEVGPLLYYSQYAPHAGVYTPLYLHGAHVPKPFTIGSLFRFDYTSSYWRFAAVGNWIARFFRYAYPDVQEVQRTLEDVYFAEQPLVEKEAMVAIDAGETDKARELLATLADDATDRFMVTYIALFEELIARFHDGYKMMDPFAVTIDMQKFFYPLWWLKAAGFFYDSNEATEAATAAVPMGSGAGLFFSLLLAIGCGGAGYYIGRNKQQEQRARKGYMTVNTVGDMGSKPYQASEIQMTA